MDCREVADGITVRDGQLRLYTFAVFSAAVSTGNDWELIGEPQRDPYRACMLLAAAIWKRDPGICLTELQAQVENAVSALRKGARKATICDDRHRVERTDLVVDITLARIPANRGPRDGTA
jgi:hypothetical protein